MLTLYNDFVGELSTYHWITFLHEISLNSKYRKNCSLTTHKTNMSQYPVAHKLKASAITETSYQKNDVYG